MSARINHVAITSDYYATNARFYESLFGMRTAKKTLPPSRAISLGDGYVGMTHIPRRDGRTAKRQCEHADCGREQLPRRVMGRTCRRWHRRVTPPVPFVLG